MEIKITISDTGAGSGAGAGGTGSVQVSGESVGSGTGTESSAAGGQQVAAPPEVLRAAAAIGAIDAGPAPNAASTQSGVPPPFSAGSDLGDVMSSPGTSAGTCAAVAPDRSSVVESVAPTEDVTDYS